MNFKLDEQEIGIVINAADKYALITITGYKLYLRKLEKLSNKYPEEYQLIKEYYDNDGILYGKSYKVNKRFIRLGKPASKERQEQGRRAAEIMRANKGT